MKKIVMIVGIVLVVLAGSLIFKKPTNANEDYLRLHIRAHSNSEQDQAVKYKVKTAIVEFLQDKIEKQTSKQGVEKVLTSEKQNIKAVAEDVLSKNGFCYGANVEIKNEFFPTRSYEDLVLSEGYYDALIVELGSAKGDNWWCVVYPPLCFASPSGKNVVYKSKIMEIIQNWKNK